MITARASIEELYRTHGHAVLRRARNILRSEEDAREVLHEVFVSLLGEPERVRAAALTTWLYSATTHACLNRLRNTRTRARILEAAKGLEDPHAPGSAEDAVVVRQILADVPEELARVAIHHYLDEMTHEEIAEVLGCSRRRVGDLLVRLGEHVTRRHRS